MPKLSLFFDNKQPNTCLWALHSELKSQKKSNIHVMKNNIFVCSRQGLRSNRKHILEEKGYCIISFFFHDTVQKYCWRSSYDTCYYSVTCVISDMYEYDYCCSIIAKNILKILNDMEYLKIIIYTKNRKLLLSVQYVHIVS